MRCIPWTRAAALAIGAAALLPPAEAATEGGQARLDGTWRVTRHGVNCDTGQTLSTFPALMTFNQGGTLSSWGVPPGAAPPQGSPEYGVWKGGPGLGKYAFRFLSLGYDDTGAYNGYGEISGRLTLVDGDSFTYKSTIAFFDSDGNLLFTLCGKAEGGRF